MSSNIDDLKNLIAEGNLDGVKQVISQYVDDEVLTSTDEGRAYVMAAKSYMDVANEANQRYLDALDQLIFAVKSIDKLDKKVENEEKKASIKQDIGKIFGQN